MIIVYNVTLEWRMKPGELDTLARRVKQRAPITQLMSVRFFLRGMSPEAEAWAISNYNPDLDAFEVEINEAATTSNLPDVDLRQDAGP